MAGWTGMRSLPRKRWIRLKLRCLYILSALAAALILPPTSFAAGVKVLGLEEVLSAVIKHHPAVSGKKAEVFAKEFASESARAGRYPTISGQAGYQEENETSLLLRARQPLWAFGRISSNIEFADADVLADRAEFLKVQRALLNRASTVYARVLAGYKRRDVLEDNIKRHEEFYEKIKRREVGQLASQADTKLASVRLIQARAKLQRSEGELQIALNDLHSLTQITVEGVKPVGDSVVALPVDGGDIERLALKNSAEIKFKKRLVEVAKAETRQVKSSGMPTVFLQVDKNFNQAGIDNDTRYSVIVSGDLEGMGFSTLGRTKAALAGEVAATESLNLARTELTRDVRSLIENRQVQFDLAGVQRESAKESDTILKSYMRQYEAGRKAWLDVLNFQREYTEQRLQQAEAESEWLAYSLRLKTLIGSFDRFIEGGKE